MFGEDGQQRMIKTLKQQIQDRDARYSKLVQQKAAQDEQLKELKQSAEVLRIKADNEESRAERSESALKSTKDDLAQAKLNVRNLETRLRAESDRATEFERENKRLEFELQSVTSTSNSGPSTMENKLAARVKSLEQDLQRKEGELAKTRAEQTSASANSSMTAANSRGRRRASSVSGDLSNLATQRDDATQLAASARKEVDTLKVKLQFVDHERDQAVNERMALEKRTSREIDRLQDRVDELTFWLDGRSDKPYKETEKLRSELQTTLSKLEALQDSLEKKEVELERLRASSQDAMTASEAQAAELSAKISALESEIAEARSSRPADTGRSSNLQRELNAALRRTEAKERENADLALNLQEANEENQALRQGGSTSQPQRSGGAELASRISVLEEQLAQVERERNDATAKATQLQKLVDESAEHLEASHAELEKERKALSALREQTGELEKKAAGAEELQNAVTGTQARVSELEREAEALSTKFAEAENALHTVQGQQSAAERARDEVMAKMDETLAQASQQQQRISQLENELSGSKSLHAELSSARNELKRWRSAAETYQAEIMEMEDELRKEIDEVNDNLAIVTEDLARAVSDRSAALAQVKLLQEEIMTASGDKDREIAQLRQQRDNLHAQLQEQVLLLDRPVKPSAPDNAQIERMGATIVRLREQRDEARGEAKFADEQFKFAERTAKALEADSAKLQATQAQLEENFALVSSLNTEKTELEVKINTLQTQVDGASETDAQLQEKAALVEQLVSEQAALENKIAALEEQIRAHETSSESLESAQAQLEEKAALVDTLSSEKAELEAKIADLESQVSANTELATERDDLAERLGAVEAERDAARSQLAELESQMADLRTALDGVSQTLRDTEAALAKEQEARTAAENRAELHSASGDEAAQRLLAEQHQRVERRDKHIKNLEADKQKLDFNLKSVQEDIQELSEAHEDLKAKYAELEQTLEGARTGLNDSRSHARSSDDRLQAMQENIEALHVDLESLKSTHSRTLAEHKALKADHEDIKAHNAALVNQHAELAAELGAATAQDDEGDVTSLVLAIAVHREAVVATAERADRTAADLQVSIGKVTALEAEQSVFLQERSDSASLRDELESTRAALVDTEERLSALQATSTDLAATTEQAAALEARIGELEGELDTIKSDNEGTTSRVAELEAELAASQESLTAMETATVDLAAAVKQNAELEARIGELEGELDASRSANADATARVAELEKEIAASQESLYAAEAEHKAALDELNAQMDEINTEAEQQIAATNDEAAKAKAAHTQTISELETALASVRAQGAADLADANDRLKTAEDDVSALSETINSLQRDFVKARSEHSTASTRAEDAESLVDSLRADVARVTGELEAAHEVAQNATERIEALVSDLSIARADQSTLGAELDATQADLDNAHAELEDLRSKEERLSSQLSEARDALDAERAALHAAETRASTAESDSRKSSSHLNFMERQQTEMSSRLAALREDLAASQDAASSLPAKEEEIGRLASANAALKAELQDLEEDLKYKIAALDAKNLDIEEADDREMELKKQIKKIGARADKLSRKNKALESEIDTLQNTMENMSPRRRDVPSIAFVSPAPPRLSTGQSAVASISKHASSATPAGTKRTREPEDIQHTREVWVGAEPEPVLKTRTSPGARQPLTSRTGNERPVDRPVAGRKPLTSTERAFMQKRAQLAQTTPSERKTLTPSVRNVFAAATTPGATPGEPRNVFAPGSGRGGL